MGATKKGTSAIHHRWYYVVVGTLALYSVLVPGICALIALGRL